MLVQELQSQISSFDRDRGKRLQAAQAKLAKAKASLDAAKHSLKERQLAASQAAAELEAAAGERGSLGQQLHAAQAALEGVFSMPSAASSGRSSEVSGSWVGQLSSGWAR